MNSYKNAEDIMNLTEGSECNPTPTLFIGLGGTGAGVLFNLRRNMLSHVWSGGEGTQISSLSEFPCAEYLCIDLDFSSFVAEEKAVRNSLHAELLFKPSEAMAKRLDLLKYLGSDEIFQSFPHVEEWFPIPPRKAEALNFLDGCYRSIRSISRLYFYDRFRDIKSSIEQALSNLRNNALSSDKHKRLGLKPDPQALRVVVVASVAGSTGSGTLIDVGYLSKILLSKCGVKKTYVTSLLILPTAYKWGNAKHMQANSYATLMELESCMLGSGTHVSSWDGSEEFSAMPARPFDDIYLLDTENQAFGKTDNEVDSLRMAADVLFQDLLGSEYSQKKRFSSVNQRQHTIFPYNSKVGQGLYGKAFRSSFTRSYSSFGQSVLDMQLQLKQANALEYQVLRMLAVLFGYSAEKDTFGHSNYLSEAFGELFNSEVDRIQQKFRALMAGLLLRIKFNNESIERSSAMFQNLSGLDGAAEEAQNISEADLRSWVDEVFANLGAELDQFKTIESPDGGFGLCAKLRNHVNVKTKQLEQQRRLGNEVNPLIAALDALPLGERKSMLVQTMQRAMPWAALKLDGYLKEEKPEEQYKCLIGVKDHVEFKKRYGDMLLAAIPPSSKMTATQVGFVEISEPGRLVCYVELSGLPLPAIRSLADWHAAYKVENKKIPVHTHKQVSKFVHVIEMNESELASRYSDFELMVQALALGDLSRSPKCNENGRLRLKIRESERSVGDERVIRLNGFEDYCRSALQGKSENSLGLLKSPSQKEIWYLLMLYYVESVYPIWEKTSEDNATCVEKYLPTLVCENLLERARLDLLRSGKSAAEIEQLKKIASEVLHQWSDEIVGSEADPYPHEVGGPEGAKLQPKRALKMEVFGEDWTHMSTPNALPSKMKLDFMPFHQSQVLPPSLPKFGPMPPPLALSTSPWHLHVNGTNYGPFALDLLRSMIPTGQFGSQTMVWREGMPAWLPACTVPELSVLFMPAPVSPPFLNTRVPQPKSANLPPFAS